MLVHYHTQLYRGIEYLVLEQIVQEECLSLYTLGLSVKDKNGSKPKKANYHAVLRQCQSH